MKVPVLMNGREVVRSWRGATPVHPEVREIGYGTSLDMNSVTELVGELAALTRTLASNDEGRRQFDQQVSRLLGERLDLPPAFAADRRFWQWFSITRAHEAVLWRWKKSAREAVSEDRWLGGWKDTFRRLWLRANIIREEGADDPFALAGLGDEDFWVGIIERDIAACRGLVRELVRRFFGSTAADTGSTQRMLHYRSTLKRLRQIRPNRVYEQMSNPEVVVLVRDAVDASIPPAPPPGDGKPRTTGKKNASRKKGARKPPRRR